MSLTFYENDEVNGQIPLLMYEWDKTNNLLIPLDVQENTGSSVTDPVPGQVATPTHSGVTTDGWTSAWNAPSVDLTHGAPTGYQVYKNGVAVGAVLPATQRTRAFTAQAAGTYTVQVQAINSNGPGPISNSDSITVTGGGGGGTVRFAGHVPNRNIVGISASENKAPVILDAIDLLTPPGIYLRRWETPARPSTSELQQRTSWCDSRGLFPFLTFKAVDGNGNNDWAGYAAGNYDSTVLQAVKDFAIAKRTANGGNGKPFNIGLHHEPSGDGTLSVWASMQIHLSNFLASVNDICVVSAIGNGFWWGGADDTANINAAFPSNLISTFKTNRHVIGADFYDRLTAGYQTGALGDFADFLRSNDIMGAIGEWGSFTGPSLTAAWNVIHANRDYFALVTYFDSYANSRADWRLVPSNYAATGSTPAGDADSGARLTAFINTVLPQSLDDTAP
jgi:hypothetical protein